MATQSRTTPAHEHAGIFALHEGQPLWDLSDRIKANGLREPIVLLEKKILDGRRRELACIRAGVKPRYREFGSKKEDGDDPLEFVIDVNLHRRHLGEGERALAAAKYATAKVGGNRKPSSQFATMAFPSSQIATMEIKTNENIDKTNAEAAEKFNTTESKVDRAKAILANGTPELQEAVLDGTLSVSDAAKVSTEAAKVQQEAVDAVRNGEVTTATVAVAKIIGKKSRKKTNHPAEKKEETEECKEDFEDANGIPWKDKAPRALKAIEASPDLRAMSRTIAGVIKRLEDGEHLRLYTLSLQSVIASLKSVKEAMLGSMPSYVCPYCEGTGKTLEGSQSGKSCEVCQRQGWVTKSVYKRSPKGQAK